MVRFAALGLGVAVLPRSIAGSLGDRPEPPRILEITGAEPAQFRHSPPVRPWPRPRLRRTVAVVHRKDGPESPAARAFFELAGRPLAS